MNAAKKGTAPSGFGRLAASTSRVFGGAGGVLVTALIVFGGLGVGGYFAWQEWGSSIVDSPQFHLTADDVDMTPPPSWIQTDIRREVFRESQLGRLSLIDPEATVKIARAFEGHTWVAEVRRVSKQAPRKVTVEVVYRRPIAMVEVPLGYWPVDTEGVLLPVREFSEAQTDNYLKIVGANAEPAGPIGTAYGDPRVQRGAMLATLLEGAWRSLKINRIVAREALSTATLESPEFDLYTQRGVRILWGHAPGDERPGEPTAREKLTRLLEYVEANGTLDDKAGVAELDVTNLQGALPPRTANLRDPAAR